MAFQSEEGVSCSICQDILKDPVVLSCSHSFCELCLRNCWIENLTKECPVCKRRSSSNLPQNPGKVLDTGKLQLSLSTSKEKLQLMEEFKENCDLSLAHIKIQSRHTEKLIQDQFKKLHQFLLEEEEARMRALREEEEQKTQRMKDKMSAVSREIETLLETIRATEEQLRAADVSFLLRYKAAVETVQHCPLLEEPQLGSGTLIDQAKHLGNLGFDIWTNMKRLVQYTPVILDPNRAHPELILSEDLTSLRFGKKQKLPKNPDRFKNYPIVFGSEGFDSGSHSWDVEVGDSADWALGVVTERLIELLEEEFIDADAGCWSVTFSDGGFKAVNIEEKRDTFLKLESNPQRIRVHLDCEKHELTFYDADTNAHIHSFTQIYRQKMFPIFSIKDPLKILQGKM